jgi:3-oxoacyl-[acyl-carrier-protein] synthase-1
MTNRVHIAAVSAWTPVGLSAASTAAAVRAGISRIGSHPVLTNRDGEYVSGGLLRHIDAGLVGPTRMTSLASGALGELVANAGPRFFAAGTRSLLVALPEARPGFGDAEAREVLHDLETGAAAQLRASRIEPCGRGHAGGLVALAIAADRIASGTDDVCIVGGVDSYYDYETLEWMQDNRQLTTATTRDGFPPGEAASFVVLAAESALARLGCVSLARVRGWGVAHEANRIKTEDVNLGRGLAQAFTGAFASLGLPGEAADAVYCDINGERYRSEEFAFAWMRHPHAMRDQGYETVVRSCGDVGAASGPLGCVLAVQSWARRYAHGPRALVWGSSEGGARAAVVLQDPERA